MPVIASVNQGSFRPVRSGVRSAKGNARRFIDEPLLGPGAFFSGCVCDLLRCTLGEPDVTLSARSSRAFESLTLTTGACRRLPEGSPFAPPPWFTGPGAAVEPFVDPLGGSSNGGA